MLKINFVMTLISFVLIKNLNKNTKSVDLLIIRLLIINMIILFPTTAIHATDLALEIYNGYGIIEFKENENFKGDHLDSYFKYNVISFGFKSKYQFSKKENLFVVMNTDWMFGLKETEAWRLEGVEVQKNEMEISIQFYSLGIGYKKEEKRFFSEVYMLGGWDRLKLKRERYVWQGRPLNKSSVEKISLWKVGSMWTIGFMRNKWLFEQIIESVYYFRGNTKDTSLPKLLFDTKGYQIGIKFKLIREFIENFNFYCGGSYILQRLKGNTLDENITWRTEFYIIEGLLGLKLIF